MCESISKFGKFTNLLNNNKPVNMSLFLRILLNFSVFIIIRIFQLIPHVLLTPTNFCFYDQMITSLPGVLDIAWSPLNIGIYLYWNELRNAGLSFSQPGYSKKPTDVFFLYSIPRKAYGLRHIDRKTRTCSISFSDLKPFVNTKWNAPFSILRPKNAKKQMKTFVTPFFNLWNTMKFGLQDQLFMQKTTKNLQGAIFSQCRSKTPILAKINMF